jgi:SAM-dependent methyltransferase
MTGPDERTGEGSSSRAPEPTGRSGASAVRDYWEGKACGSSRASSPEHSIDHFREADRFRYRAEPVAGFAAFQDARGQRVLEIGTGMGGDLQRYLQSGANAVGIDLSGTAVRATHRRLRLWNLPDRAIQADALALPFRSRVFDVVYSWGVLHHTPSVRDAIREAHRVLIPGGQLRIMLYHRPSWVALAAWLRWGLLAGRPFQGLRQVVADHVESPGTFALTTEEIHAVLSGFSDRSIRVIPTYWDRRYVPGLGRLFGSRLGWFALVTARATTK